VTVTTAPYGDGSGSVGARGVCGTLPGMTDPADLLLPADQRALAVRLFNRTWELLESSRDAAAERELLATALASRLHWQDVGTDENLAAGDWLVAHVARTKIPVAGPFMCVFAASHRLVHNIEQFVQGRPFSQSDVIDLVGRLRTAHSCGEQVGLNDVGYVTKIAGRLSVSIDVNAFILEERCNPFRYHRRITPFRVLALTKNIEIAQAY